jgi:hypothetical protein
VQDLRELQPRWKKDAWTEKPVGNRLFQMEASLRLPQREGNEERAPNPATVSKKYA